MQSFELSDTKTASALVPFANFMTSSHTLEEIFNITEVLTQHIGQTFFKQKS